MFDKYNYFLLSKIAPDVGQIIGAEHSHTLCFKDNQYSECHFAVLIDLRGKMNPLKKKKNKTFLLTQIS